MLCQRPVDNDSTTSTSNLQAQTIYYCPELGFTTLHQKSATRLRQLSCARN